MGLIRTVEPVLEPIERDVAKLHLRLDTDEQDALVDALIAAARSHAELYLGRALITQTWRLSLDTLPVVNPVRVAREVIRLPYPRLQSVTSVTYVDDTGATQTMDPADYQVDADSEPARLRPAYGLTWPSVRGTTLGAVRVTYVAGYGTEPASVPAAIRHGMLLLIGNLYENAEATIIGSAVNELPFGVAALWGPYRILEFA